MKKKNTMSGITLIALVITIIVLLILAGVSISMVTGENGVLSRATKAADETEYAQEKDHIDIALASVITDKKIEDDETNISIDELQSQLDQDLGSGVVEITAGENEDILLATFHDGTNRKHYVNAKWGDSSAANSVYWQQIIGEAKVHPDQPSIITDIGIGTDGEPVNLDYWYYYESNGEIHLGKLPTDRYTYANDYKVGYIGPVSGGAISGKMPQYIIINGEAFPVVHLDFTFRNIDDLTKAPEIPTTVQTMYGTFMECDGLIETPKFPESLISMGEEDTVKPGTFENCTSLTTVKAIPSSVKKMVRTFYNCVGLRGSIVVNATPTSYSNCFYGVYGMAEVCSLTGKSEILSKLNATVSGN